MTTSDPQTLTRITIPENYPTGELLCDRFAVRREGRQWFVAEDAVPDLTQALDALECPYCITTSSDELYVAARPICALTRIHRFCTPTKDSQAYLIFLQHFS